MNLHGPRGKGVRRKVSGYIKLPDNWMDFLRDSMNKKELCYTDSQGCTVQQSTLCVSHQGKLWFPLVKAFPCKTVIMRRQTPGLWFTYCMLWSRGADYICAHCRHICRSYPCWHIPWSGCDSTFGRHLSDLWHEQELSVLPCQRNLLKPGEQQPRALPVFHAFSGCDTINCLQGQGQGVGLAGLADT